MVPRVASATGAAGGPGVIGGRTARRARVRNPASATRVTRATSARKKKNVSGFLHCAVAQLTDVDCGDGPQLGKTADASPLTVQINVRYEPGDACVVFQQEAGVLEENSTFFKCRLKSTWRTTSGGSLNANVDAESTEVVNLEDQQPKLLKIWLDWLKHRRIAIPNVDAIDATTAGDIYSMVFDLYCLGDFLGDFDFMDAIVDIAAKVATTLAPQRGILSDGATGTRDLCLPAFELLEKIRTLKTPEGRKLDLLFSYIFGSPPIGQKLEDTEPAEHLIKILRFVLDHVSSNSDLPRIHEVVNSCKCHNHVEGKEHCYSSKQKYQKSFLFHHTNL